MTRVRKTLVAVAAAALSVSLVAACSGSSGGGSNPTGTKKSGVGQAPTKKTNNAVNDMASTPRSGIKPGGTLTFGLSGIIPTFNYWNVNGGAVDTINVLNALLPNPFHFDAAGTPSVNTDYFTSIKETSTKPQTIEYKINPKAKWSDGKPLSYLDFQSLWKAMNGSNPKFQTLGATGWANIGSVTQGANAQDVIVTFTKPYTDWQGLFLPLEPASLTATPAAFNKAWTAQPLVTSGPFKWGSQNKTQKSYTVVKDPKWWGDPAELNSITFQVYNDPSAAVQAVGSHQLQYEDISTGNAVQNVQAVQKYSGIAIRQAGGNNYRQFTLNTKDPLLSDVKVRQAIFLGINRQLITTALIGKLGGNPTPLNNNFFMKNQTAYQSTCGQLCNYDPTAAKKLLEGDGWTLKGSYFEKGGKQLSVSITIPAQTPNSLTEAQLAQSSLKAAGIKLTITTVPSDPFFPDYIFSGSPSSSSKFQITTFTWVGQPFPVGSAIEIFTYDPKAKGQNAGFGGSAQINTLLEKAYTSPTSAQENALANQAGKLMWANAAWLPLYQRPQVFAVDSKIVNLGAPGFADIRYQDIGYKK